MSDRLLDPAGLWPALEQRVPPEALAWVREAVADVAADPAAVRSRFPMAGRKVGRAPLDPAASADDVHAWTIDDAARTLLLAALGDGVEAELADLYRYGDAAERRGLLRALPYLPVGDRGGRAGRRRDPHERHAARRRRARPVRDRAPRRRRLRSGGAQVRLHRRADRAARRAARAGDGRDRAHARRVRARARRRRARHPRRGVGRDRPASRPRAELAAIEAERESAFPDRREAAERALRASPERRSPMRIFEPHAHMTSRTTDDYEAMAASGVKVLVEPAFWLGQPRTSAGLVRRLLQLAAGLGAVPRVAVRHPPPLHDRAQPEGGQRRRAAPRGAGAAAALPGQGRRRRGRRDRLRRDDAGRGRGAARPVRARARARAARARPHAAPRQGRRARARRSSSSRRPGSRPRWS